MKGLLQNDSHSKTVPLWLQHFHLPWPSTKVILGHTDGKDQAVLTCSFLHLHQYEGTNLAWRIEFPMSLYPGITIGGTHNFKWNILTEKQMNSTLNSCIRYSTTPQPLVSADEQVQILDKEH